MNVYGVKIRPRLDPETGLERARGEESGMIRLWRRVDRSRSGMPDTHTNLVAFLDQEVPTRTADTYYDLADTGEPLSYDPARDVWSAPEWIEQLDLIVTIDPETKVAMRVYPIRPRPEGWVPDDRI